MTCRPGHAAKWPDFDADNEVALTHGAHSERRWRPLAEQLRAAILDDAPWLSRPAFAAALEAWSIVEAKSRLVDDWLDEHGLLDDDGVPLAANGLADRLAARAITLRGQLGLDPVSFAKLLATFAGVPGGEDALEALKREGARLVEARSGALEVAVPAEKPRNNGSQVSDPRKNVYQGRSATSAEKPSPRLGQVSDPESATRVPENRP